MSDQFNNAGNGEPSNSSENQSNGVEKQPIEERRSSDLGPPAGVTERRVLNQRLFDRRAQGSTTGELLVEVGRFAAENMAFRQKTNKAAARRARKHLSLIMKLAKQRRAEISAEIKALSPGGADDLDDDDSDD